MHHRLFAHKRLRALPLRILSIYNICTEILSKEKKSVESIQPTRVGIDPLFYTEGERKGKGMWVCEKLD